MPPKNRGVVTITRDAYQKAQSHYLQRIHYNFVKPHQALEGMTPAQRAGIGNQNTWLALLKQAQKESFE